MMNFLASWCLQITRLTILVTIASAFSRSSWVGVDICQIIPMSMIATYTLRSTGTRFSFWMSLLFCTFRKAPFVLKTDKDSTVIQYYNISLKLTSPLFSTVFIIAVSPTFSMILVVTISLPDAEVSFLSFVEVIHLCFGTESKSYLTLVKTHSSKIFISFACPSA